LESIIKAQQARIKTLLNQTNTSVEDTTEFETLCLTVEKNLEKLKKLNEENYN
jgi:Zn-finger domain-containing protein